ncbi:MAG: PmoA family protein [Candidatus Hydrogenedentes bacterium]|nr:PmoA family protein [Candidatus Hydrogenedentota bacterium]
MKTRTIRLFAGLAATGFAAMFCHAQGLAGRSITLEGSDHIVANPIISLPYDGPKADGRFVAVEDKTGKRYPVTVADGAVYFSPDGVMPNAKVLYQIAKDEGDGGQPKVRIEKKEGAAVDVLIDDQLFTTYHYSNDNKKPFLWPLNAAGGVPMTRDFPMGPKVDMGPDLKTDDHPHHRSFWSAHGKVNDADCWMEEGPKGDRKGSGYQHSGEVTFGSGDVFGWIKAKNEWQNADHKTVLDEAREYRFYASPAEYRIFDVTVTFTASHGDVKFGDTKEGGIVSLRIRDDLREDAKKGGLITLSTGAKTEKEVWGKPAAWCDYSGPIEGVGVRGVTVFDNTANLRFPTCWHVRAYGLFAANPFGLAAFTAKDPSPKNGDYTLPSGKSLVFKYRVLVHVDDAEKAKVADRYKDYATPPKAVWSK